jgi:hypothetical protein
MWSIEIDIEKDVQGGGIRGKIENFCLTYLNLFTIFAKLKNTKN